jgi:hypothetical protein
METGMPWKRLKKVLEQSKPPGCRQERKSREVFVSLAHPSVEAQVDFGHALVKEAGRLRKVALFVMVLPYSDALFLKVCERECTETFWEGHVEAF